MKGVKKGGSWGYEPPWGERHLMYQEALHRVKKSYYATMWHVKSFFLFFWKKTLRQKHTKMLK
jgi:hypothetical protein